MAKRYGPRKPRSSLTTGEAARLLDVSQQTIIRAFDTGKLKGWRVPGSKFRRVPRAELLAYATAHGIPVDEADPAWGTLFRRAETAATEPGPDAPTAA